MNEVMMKTIGFIFVLGIIFGQPTAFAQNSRTNETPMASTDMSEVQESAPKIRKRDLPKIRYAKKRNEFVEQRIKEKRHQAAEMKKPQYANKLYFGHKHPPKKRPLGKQKYCSECGMKH